MTYRTITKQQWQQKPTKLLNKPKPKPNGKTNKQTQLCNLAVKALRTDSFYHKIGPPSQLSNTYSPLGPEEGIHLALLSLSAQNRPLAMGIEETLSPSLPLTSLYPPSGHSRLPFLQGFMDLGQQLPFVLDSHILQRGAPSTPYQACCRSGWPLLT